MATHRPQPREPAHNAPGLEPPDDLGHIPVAGAPDTDRVAQEPTEYPVDAREMSLRIVMDRYTAILGWWSQARSSVCTPGPSRSTSWWILLGIAFTPLALPYIKLIRWVVKNGRD